MARWDIYICTCNHREAVWWEPHKQRGGEVIQLLRENTAGSLWKEMKRKAAQRRATQGATWAGVLVMCTYRWWSRSWEHVLECIKEHLFMCLFCFAERNTATKKCCNFPQTKDVRLDVSEVTSSGEGGGHGGGQTPAGPPFASCDCCNRSRYF